VVDGVAQELGRSAHLARQVAAGVDGGIPAPPAQRRQIAAAIAAQPFQVGKQLGMGAAAVEERDLVAARPRRLDQVAPEVERAAQDQESHRHPRSISMRCRAFTQQLPPAAAAAPRAR
jgi:hypothetical protein